MGCHIYLYAREGRKVVEVPFGPDLPFLRVTANYYGRRYTRPPAALRALTKLREGTGGCKTPSVDCCGSTEGTCPCIVWHESEDNRSAAATIANTIADLHRRGVFVRMEMG